MTAVASAIPSPALTDEAGRRRQLVLMRRRATGLLVVMTVVFVVARLAEEGGGAWVGYLRATGLRRCTPVNGDDSVVPQPLLGLNAGYVTRAADRFPKAGSRFPWQVKQSYLDDYRSLKRKPIVDRVMQFT